MSKLIQKFDLDELEQIIYDKITYMKSTNPNVTHLANIDNSMFKGLAEVRKHVHFQNQRKQKNLKV